ncbi:MAG TPA: hypothetical protein VFO58_26375, partial [Vicinamibacterales bacterium]|nr:hypothetical protein [Vicinamibacterales bacterium]
ADRHARAVEFEQLLTALDAFEVQMLRTGTRGLSLAMATNSSERDVLRDVLEVMGIRLRERRGAYSAEPDDDDEAVSLRKRLDSAGIDTSAVVKRLNAGETVTPSSTVVDLPSPLPLETWTSVVFERSLPPRSVFSAIARDRQASLLFYGLQTMTPRTRAFVAGNRELLQRLYRDLAGSVAAFGRSFRVDDRGRVVVPGGLEAEDVWKELVGEPLERADRFARALFDRDAGRLAYFFDAIAHLDAPRQRFALGLWVSNPEIRLDRFRALYRTFVDVDSPWVAPERPFMRPLYDPATLLALAAVGQEGEPASPSYRRLWERAFEAVDLPDPGDRLLGDVSEDGVVDAAWLVEHAMRDAFSERRALFERLMFGHRVFGGVREQELEDVLVALRGFGRFPALMLTLERIGIRRPALFALVARHARHIEGVSDQALAVRLLTQFQGALALLDRLARTGAVAAPRLEELVSSLAALPIDDRGYRGALAAWVNNSLLPSLPARDPDGARPLESSLLRALAETGEDGSPFAWEGESYVTDIASASLRELVAIRSKQGGNSLDDVLALFGHAAALGQNGLTIESIKPHAASIASTSAKLSAARPWPDVPDEVPNIKRILDRAARDLGRIQKPQDVSRAPRIAEPIVALAEDLLGETLVALAYAPFLGDPEELLGPQSDVSHRHRFGLAARPNAPSTERQAWRRPVVDGDGVGLGYTGSLLGLDLALANRRLRRLSTNTVPAAPRISPNDGAALVESLALLNSRSLATADLRSIGEAVTRGRERVRTSRTNPAVLDELANAVQMSDARRQLLAWTQEKEPDRIEALFAPSELLRLGLADRQLERIDAWGGSYEAQSGCYCSRFPPAGAWDRLAGRPGTGQLGPAVASELILRVAEHLAALGVPAGVATAVLAIAAQDYIDGAPPIFEDDWLGLVGHAQLVSRESVEDYVAAAVAAGPARAAAPRESSK